MFSEIKINETKKNNNSDSPKLVVDFYTSGFSNSERDSVDFNYIVLLNIEKQTNEVCSLVEVYF